MQVTTYYVSHKAGLIDHDVEAMIHLINDTGASNGDNRSWNAMHAQLDNVLNAEAQGRLGIMIQAEQCEATEDE